MSLIGRDRDWTIYFRDGASDPPAVHPGHDRPDYEGWEAMEVVRADVYQGAVGILRELAQMPLRASGKDYDRLVKAARDLLPEYTATEGSSTMSNIEHSESRVLADFAAERAADWQQTAMNMRDLHKLALAENEALAEQLRGAVEDVSALVNALADAASRFRRDGDVFGAEQAEAILKRFGGQ